MSLEERGKWPPVGDPALDGIARSTDELEGSADDGAEHDEDGEASEEPPRGGEDRGQGQSVHQLAG